MPAARVGPHGEGTVIAATAAQQIADFSVSLPADGLPLRTRQATKEHLLDTVGCALVAHSQGGVSAPLEVMLEAGGIPEAAVIGTNRRLPAAGAALAGGALAHALDFDSTHAASVCHIGAVVHPAALAAAQAVGADGAQLLNAVAIGTEVVARLGMTVPSGFHDRGFHPTSVCGVFGAAVAAARLYGLSRQQTANALGIAGSMASGTFEYLADGSNTKPLHAGWAAHAGVIAAQLAARGATGPATTLEGRFGLFATYANRSETPLLQQLADLGERWESDLVAYKPYPACHFLHSSVDAADRLARAHHLSATDVAEVAVAVPDQVVPIVLEPAEYKLAPRTPYDAKFSLPYSVAAMLVHGRVDVLTYSDEAIREPDTLALARKVRWRGEHFDSFPDSFPCEVTITTRNGTAHTLRLEHQRGGQANPMTTDDLADKFRQNAEQLLDGAGIDACIRRILTLEDQPDLDGIVDPVTGGPSTPAAAAPAPAVTG